MVATALWLLNLWYARETGLPWWMLATVNFPAAFVLIAFTAKMRHSNIRFRLKTVAGLALQLHVVARILWNACPRLLPCATALSIACVHLQADRLRMAAAVVAVLLFETSSAASADSNNKAIGVFLWICTTLALAFGANDTVYRAAALLSVPVLAQYATSTAAPWAYATLLLPPSAHAGGGLSNDAEIYISAWAALVAYAACTYPTFIVAAAAILSTI